MRRILDDAVLTLVTEFLVLLSFFLFFRLLAHRFDAEQVGTYALFRRVLALVLPLALLGLTEGLAKYLAQASTASHCKRMLVASLSGVIASSTSISVIIIAFPEMSADFFFGDASLVEIVAPCTVYALALIAHSYVYAVLRGMLRVGLLNLFQFLNLAAIPVLVIAVAPAAGFADVLRLIGLVNGFVSGLFLLVPRESPGLARPAAMTHTSVSELYSFSLARIPGALIGAALASLVPLVAKDQLPIMEVGYLSIAISLMIGLAGILSPLGTVLLPHLSLMVSRHETGAIGRKIHLLIGATLHLYLFATAQLVVFADYFVEIWLGQQFLPAASILRVTCLALVGFGFYSTTRSVLDAVTRAPVNSVNTFIAVGTLWVLTAWTPRIPWSTQPALYFAWVYAVAGIILGVLTYGALRFIFRDHIREDVRHMVWGTALCAAFGLLALVAKSLVLSHFSFWLAFEAVSFGLYLLCIWYLKFEWIRVVGDRLGVHGPR